MDSDSEPIYSKRKRSIFQSSSDEDSDSDIYPDNKWIPKNLKPKLHSFCNDIAGAKDEVKSSCTILDFFKVFVNAEFMELIVKQTNDYQLYKYASLENHSEAWQEVTCKEMYCFLAIAMLMTRNKKLCISEYWSTDKFLKSDIFGQIMSRNRFFDILKMLHFCDNNITSNTDRLNKIRAILDIIRHKFRESFRPSEKLCIDESLLLFKGRLSFKQYIPSKRTRFGVKTFVLCDCISGYVLDLIIYTGATTLVEAVYEGIGKSGNIVMELLSPYLGNGHTIYMDNWFTSPKLFQLLFMNKVNACGTVRKNRKDMPQINGKLKDGEWSFRATKTMLALKWQDKRDVWMLTTAHSAEYCLTGKKNYKTGNPILKPTCVVDYNLHMGAVDKRDMVLSTLKSVRKSQKWYKKVFFHLFDICVYNARILHKDVTGQNLSFAQFQLQLIKEIISECSERRKKAGGGRLSIENILRLSERHFPSICQSEIASNSQRNCVVCKKAGIRKRSHYQCSKCNIGLCVVPCFERYHTLQDY